MPTTWVTDLTASVCESRTHEALILSARAPSQRERKLCEGKGDAALFSSPHPDDLGAQVRELATSQVVSDRLAFAVRGSRSEQPLPRGHPCQHKSILQVDELGVVLARSCNR